MSDDDFYAAMLSIEARQRSERCRGCSYATESEHRAGVWRCGLDGLEHPRRGDAPVCALRKGDGDE